MQFHCAAILFDLDGVLVDSIAVVEKQWRIWAKKHGLDPKYVIHVAHGHRTVETVAIALPDGDHAAEAAAVEQAEIEDTAGLKAGAGAAELVSSCRPIAGVWLRRARVRWRLPGYGPWDCRSRCAWSRQMRSRRESLIRSHT